MTDDDFSLDELASAYLDDEVTADERAAIEASPSLLARVEAMRTVRIALQSDLDRLDEARLADALAAAMAVFDADLGERDRAPASTPAPAPADLAGARSRRAGRVWRPVLAIAGAAALGVAAISGVANLTAANDDDSSATEAAIPLTASDDAEAAKTSPAEAEAADDAAAGGADASRETISEIGVGDVDSAPFVSSEPDVEASEEATSAATATQSAFDAPALTTEQQLVAFAAGVERSVESTPAPTAAADGAVCADLGTRVSAVVWQGTPGELYVSERPDAGSPATATVATVDCVIIVSVALP
ncbi:MAG: hypothetical protein AB7Q42_24045 [Acidimicrobiia bacterium]